MEGFILINSKHAKITNDYCDVWSADFLHNSVGEMMRVMTVCLCTDWFIVMMMSEATLHNTVSLADILIN